MTSVIYIEIFDLLYSLSHFLVKDITKPLTHFARPLNHKDWVVKIHFSSWQQQQHNNSNNNNFLYLCHLFWYFLKFPIPFTFVTSIDVLEKDMLVDLLEPISGCEYTKKWNENNLFYLFNQLDQSTFFYILH